MSTSTTTRPSPPWLLTSQPSVWVTSTIRNPTTTRISQSELEAAAAASGNTLNNRNNNNNSNFSNNNNSNRNSSSENSKTYSITNTNGRKAVTKLKSAGTKNASSTISSTSLSLTSTTIPTASTPNRSNISKDGSLNRRNNENASVAAVTKSSENNDATDIISKINVNQSSNDHTSIASSSSMNNNGGLLESRQIHKTIQTSINGAVPYDENAQYCGPTTARNLFWNFTRVGEMNVQPCPGGATGIAKWRCTKADRTDDLINHLNRINNIVNHNDDDQQNNNSDERVMWQPITPDLTQCRSLWLNNLEVRVQQRDSSLVSIANDLSQVTNSKTLYGGDMLVTTKIIQIMSEKMSYDIETFPDQKQRESIVTELLNGVVKTGSNLLDEAQHLSWLDLSFEDQMRVATSLLTGLEDNAFLLADTIARERSVVQKVKNICKFVFHFLPYLIISFHLNLFQ